MYHLPIQRGAGWAWGPRARRRAFIRGVGFPSSLGTDSWSYSRADAIEHGGLGIRSSGAVRDEAGYVSDVENIPMQDRPVHSDERV